MTFQYIPSPPAAIVITRIATGLNPNLPKLRTPSRVARLGLVAA